MSFPVPFDPKIVSKFPLLLHSIHRFISNHEGLQMLKNKLKDCISFSILMNIMTNYFKCINNKISEMSTS